MLGRCSFLSAALLACACLQASPVCVPGTLASYEALPVTGCMVGVLTVNDFVFTVLGSSGGAVPLTDTQIIVAPIGTRLGLSFSSTGFSVTGAESVQYLIGYTWDPSDTIQSMDDVMDPPSAILGFANVTTTGCLNAAFVGSTCSTSTVSIT